ncbi:MAG: ABC transporter permease subunit [Geminicoccaceae bacterium]|nr:ABC transporter permease subunit [Geminicoccaceae bacterium]
MRLEPGRLLATPALVLVLGPTAAGLAGTVLPAFGWLPAIGREDLSLDPWRELWATPGLGRAVLLSLSSGLGSTLLALALALAIAAVLHGRPGERRWRALLPVLLAVPHAAAAVGFAFLVAPSGFLARLAAPLLGLERPPDLATVQDPWALSLTLALALREAPFLLFVILAAADRPGLDHRLAAARSLGRSRVAAWLEVALPALWPSLRLPVVAVLAYGLSAVDMALVLGPTAPPPLAVLVLRWMMDPDLDRRLVGSAAALLLLGLTLAIVLLGRVIETALRRPFRAPPTLVIATTACGRAAAGIVPAVALAGLGLLTAWSFAASWRFPAIVPTGPDLAAWRAALPLLGEVTIATALLGLASLAVALPATIAALEAPGRGRATALLWLPLLVPQVGFVFGLQVLFVRLDLAEHAAGLVLAHVVMVLPYLWLVLRGPWTRLDGRLRAAARCLGAGPLGTLWRVVLPVLLRPILAAAAIGFAVSVAQYLLTLAVGGGRFPTLATETMALVAGGDRRRIGVAAVLLVLLPLVATALAILLPERLGRRGRVERVRTAQFLGSGAKRFSMSSSVKLSPAPPPPSTPS